MIIEYCITVFDMINIWTNVWKTEGYTFLKIIKMDFAKDTYDITEFIMQYTFELFII